MHESVFQQFALLLIIAAIAGAIATRLKQPVIIAYILWVLLSVQLASL